MTYNRDLRLTRAAALASFGFNAVSFVLWAGERQWPMAVSALAWCVACLVWAKMLIPAQQETRDKSLQLLRETGELLIKIRDEPPLTEVRRLLDGIRAIREHDENDLGEYSRWVARKCDELLGEGKP